MHHHQQASSSSSLCLPAAAQRSSKDKAGRLFLFLPLSLSPSISPRFSSAFCCLLPFPSAYHRSASSSLGSVFWNSRLDALEPTSRTLMNTAFLNYYPPDHRVRKAIDEMQNNSQCDGASRDLLGTVDLCSCPKLDTDRRTGSLAERRAAKTGFRLPAIKIFSRVSPAISSATPSAAVHLPDSRVHSELSTATSSESPPVLLLHNEMAPPSPTTGIIRLPVTLNGDKPVQHPAVYEKVDDLGAFSTVNQKSQPMDAASLVDPDPSNKNDGAAVHTVSEQRGKRAAGSKRRKLNAHSTVTTAAAEPKIVIQIRSEAAVLDDGFQWIKYGQKAVRGNINPRSYYRCRAVGCNVRKRIERALHDPKVIVATYLSIHNHDAPPPADSSLSRARARPTAITMPAAAAPSFVRWQEPAIRQLNFRNCS